MSDSITSINAHLAGLLAKLSISQRRALSKEVAKTLKDSQKNRIADQKNTDGSQYEPRKPQRLRHKKHSLRKTMFQGLRKARYLKDKATPISALVQFSPHVQRFAAVHQFGLSDKVNRRANTSPTVKYPVRELLGFTTDDLETIKDLVLKHLSV